MLQTLIVLAAAFAMLVVIAFVRRLRGSKVPDHLSPEVLTRINAEYSGLPQ